MGDVISRAMRVSAFTATDRDQYVVGIVRRTRDRVEAYYLGPYPDSDQAHRVARAEVGQATGHARAVVIGVP